MVDRKSEILELFVKFFKKHKKEPTWSDWSDMGVTRRSMVRQWDSFSKLRKAAVAGNPKVFVGYFNVKDIGPIRKIKKSTKRFVVTSIINGQQVDRNILKSIGGYCKANKAELILLPTTLGEVVHDYWNFNQLSPDLHKNILFHDYEINSNLMVSGVNLSAKQINPLTGLARLAQRNHSIIVSSPKQFLEFVPVSMNSMPHALMSTGTISKPEYGLGVGPTKRIDVISNNLHTMGAIIVEIQDETIFHFRQVQFNSDGSFSDMGKRYYPNKKAEPVVPVLVMGDYHCRDVDRNAANAWVKLVKDLKIKEVVLHDFFDGKSINHHTADKVVHQAQMASQSLRNLNDELRDANWHLKKWSALVSRIVIVKSNHDEFLDRWCESGRFVQDPENVVAGCKMLLGMVGGSNALEHGLREVMTPHTTWDAKKVRFLSRDESYCVYGSECGDHGDKGPNGSRGNKKNLARIYTKCIIGHSHTPGIYEGVFQVGTTSQLRLDYNTGPSSWVHSSCLLYPDGSRQLINLIDGRYSGS